VPGTLSLYGGAPYVSIVASMGSDWAAASAARSVIIKNVVAGRVSRFCI